MAKVIKRTWTTASGEQKEAWIVRYWQKETGKQHIKTFARKKDADAYMHQTGVDIGAGTHVAPSQSITVEQAARFWLEACETNQLERATLSRYRIYVDKHIVPLVGAKKLSDLNTRQMVRWFQDELRRQGGSLDLTRKVMTALSSIVSDAYDRGLAARNAVRDRKRAKGRPSDRAKIEEGKDYPKPAEVKAIIEAATPDWRTMFRVAAFTGMRAGEIRGLRWCDIDWKAGEVRVSQRADEYCVIGKPKTKKSSGHKIPLTPRTIQALREWQVKTGGRGESLVFPSTLNTKHPRHLSVIRKGLDAACVAAGVVKPNGKAKYPGMHCLRHFFASWCINPKERGGLGLTPKEAQDRLGHANITLTYDRYGHLFPTGNDAAALAAAEDALLG
jgi:integrase